MISIARQDSGRSTRLQLHHYTVSLQLTSETKASKKQAGRITRSADVWLTKYNSPDMQTLQRSTEVADDVYKIQTSLVMSGLSALPFFFFYLNSARFSVPEWLVY